MSRLERLLARLREHDAAEALIWRDQCLDFRELEKKRLQWLNFLESRGVRSGEVVGLRADYSPLTISLFLALLSNRNIVALISPYTTHEQLLIDDSQSESIFRFEKSGSWNFEKTAGKANHPLLAALRKTDSAGFIVFSSGSTGRPKAVLHNLENFLTKFDTTYKKLRTIAFLLFDHIAGIDTLFYGLCGGGAQILPDNRKVKHICELVERHRVEVLPTSPTFLNLLLWSREYERHDLSSLKIVTYGSERMGPSTLAKINGVLPHCRFIQKYGTSEIGSPRSRSRANDDLWLNVKTSECEVKVVDHVLWVKCPSAMMGYLNAPHPFAPDGWLCTGDEVRVDGDWVQIIGRQAEWIMVGGEKVSPAEVEDAILEVDGVVDVIVRGEPFPLTGQIVCATVQVEKVEGENDELRKTIRKHCRGKLEPYKVPMKIKITDKPLVSAREKKHRLFDSSSNFVSLS